MLLSKLSAPAPAGETSPSSVSTGARSDPPRAVSGALRHLLMPFGTFALIFPSIK